MAKDSKKIMLFAGGYYYPKGGMDDLKKRFATVKEAMDCLNKEFTGSDYDWAHIYNAELFEPVFDLERDLLGNWIEYHEDNS